MTEEHRSELDMHLVNEMLKMMADEDSVHYVPSFATTKLEADKAAALKVAGDPAPKAAAKKAAKTPPAVKTPPKPKGKPKAKATKGEGGDDGEDDAELTQSDGSAASDGGEL